VLRYLVKRILLMFVTLFGITLITFMLTRLTPGDPAANRVSPGAGGNMRAQGGFDDLVEQNRRNLGLDKPYVLNFNFEDRTYLAERALDDFLKVEKLWQDVGSKALTRTNLIALEPALRRYEVIGTPNAPKVVDSKGKPANMRPNEEARAELAKLFPSLALSEAPSGPKMSPDESHAYWKKWYEENKARFEDDAVRATVADYLDGRLDIAAVRSCGGFAIPYLIKSIDDPEKGLLANDALTAITTFNFLTSPDSWTGANGAQNERERAIARWESFWRRDRPRYVTYSPIGHFANIFLNSQFGFWVKQVALFDFGDSYRNKVPVLELIKERIPRSMLISVASIMMAYIIAIPAGIFSAVKRYTTPDRIMTFTLFLLYSLPSFWVASMLIMTTTGGERFPDLFPTRGIVGDGFEMGTTGVSTWDSIKSYAHHMVLPVFVLTYGSVAFISRQMRSAMLETVKQDYVRTAQAKGVSEFSVIFKHTLRNSLIPIITISAGILPELIAGAIIVESIFTIRGMGLLTFEAITYRDYPIINAVLFFSAALTLIGILLADLCYALVDPRISYE